MRVLLAALICSGTCVAQYVGSAACARCHQAESAAQALAGHARALAKSSAKQPGDWAFGAGNQAITFVSRLNESDYLEHGETWYRASNSFGITPGHQNTGGLRYRVFDPSAGILRCFACHSTGKLEVGSDGSIIPSEAGVHCEVCHGPGAAHAANPAKARPRNPGRMDGVAMNAMCGECHRVQSSAEDGSNLLDPWNSRHQPLLLAASQCFQKSGGRLTCVSCHSPHDPLEMTQASYNSACMKCHARPAHTFAIEGRACSECHMPAVRISENLAFANHRIAVYLPGDALTPVAKVSK